MTDINLSLDEIIKKRNIKPKLLNKKPGDKRTPALKRLPAHAKTAVKEPIKDARLKLLHKKERGPVAQDARFRLEMKRSRTRLPVVPIGGLLSNRLDNPLLSPADPYALSRTIANAGPFLPRRPYDWDRPAEEDEMDLGIEREPIEMQPRPRFRPNAPDWGNISITVNSAPQTQGILKKPAIAKPFNVPHRYDEGAVKLSQRFNRERNPESIKKLEALQAILKASPAPEKMPQRETGHRLIVSNLAIGVTQQDVTELFADIGELNSSKLIHPGVAEVVYKEYEDAARAVEVYHCRQLDGQPMICQMVNPEKKAARPSVELNMSALRNALHKKATS